MLVLLVSLATGCISKPYERAVPEKRYQVAEDTTGGHRYSNGIWRPAPYKKWVKTFSLVPPEGEWTFWGPYSWGGVIFRGVPGGKLGKYVGYEVSISLSSEDDARVLKRESWQRRLQTLRTKDFQGHADAIMAEDKALYERVVNDEGGHRPIPRKESMKLVTYRGLTCTLYEGEYHISIGPYGGEKSSPGAEDYGSGYFCLGFFNGRPAEFGYGARILVDNKHVADGVEIDPAMLRDDLYRRMQRTMDSVKFDGEFTQSVPPAYQ